MSMGDKRPKKIFLISIDTLRADHLGCYGYAKDTSPNLDKLANEGVFYPYAFSPCPYTIPTHMSQVTGLYPVNSNIGFKLRRGRTDKINPDASIFLQEILRGEGYAAGAFVSALVLGKDWGLDWGFDIYDDNMTGTEFNRTDQLIRDGRETNNAALDWIMKHRGEDFFVFLHYFDVHGPYVQSSGFSAPFKPENYGDSPVLLDSVRDGQPGGIPEYQLLGVKKDDKGEIVSYQRDARYYLAGYDNGIRYVDAVIGELFDNLKSEGIYEESTIIVTADHGEALGENDVYFSHGLTVTPEQSHVPLIMKPSAGIDKPIPSEIPVSTVDIMPTILDWVGVSSEKMRLDGISLLAPNPDRFIRSENEWQRAIIWRDYYLLQAKDTVFDGFWYYFDSQILCRDTALFDYKRNTKLPQTPQDAEELVNYSENLNKAVDPIERWLKEKDRIIFEKNIAILYKDKIISGKDVVIEARDGIIAQYEKIIADKDNTIADRDGAIAERNNIITDKGNLIAGLEMKRIELESVLNSKSWRLTYPLRWVSSRLKGIYDGN